MKTRELRPRKASVELRAVAVRSRVDYRQQMAVQLVTLVNIGTGEDLCESYCVEYTLEKSSVKDLYENRKTGRAEQSGRMKAIKTTECWYVLLTRTGNSRTSRA